MDAATFHHTVTYTGPRAALATIRDGYTTGVTDAGDGVRRVATLSKLRDLTPKVSTPAHDVTRATNWLYFQIAGAVGHLSVQLQRGAKLAPQDDADLREALALLRRIDRRRVERRDNLKENA